MNDSAPLTPEQIDLLLSADLDGEFDAAASDLGLDPASARALLESVPAVDTRRDGLASARDLLAEPIEIDELLAARLRTKAVKAGAVAAANERHTARGRRTRLYGIVSGVAAALILVVALGATLSTKDSDESSDVASNATNEAPSASPTISPTRPAAGDNAARAAKALPLASAYANVDDLAADVRDQTVDFGTTPTGASESSSDSGGRAPSAQSAYKCEPVANKMQSAANQPLANGTTRVADEDLSVLVYGDADGRTLYVFNKDCKLVNRQLIH